MLPQIFAKTHHNNRETTGTEPNKWYLKNSEPSFQDANSFAGMILSVNFAVLKKEKDRILG